MKTHIDTAERKKTRMFQMKGPAGRGKTVFPLFAAMALLLAGGLAPSFGEASPAFSDVDRKIRNLEQSADTFLSILRDLRNEAEAAIQEAESLQAQIQELDEKIRLVKSGESSQKPWYKKGQFRIGIGFSN